MGDRRSGGAEGSLTDLLAELVEAEAHIRSSTLVRRELRAGVSIFGFPVRRRP
jgi:hypothetical protein